MAALLALAAFLLLPLEATAAEPEVYSFLPSKADPRVRQFDEPNYALADAGLPADAPLAVFLPGTSGRPQNTLTMLRAIAGQGYRVIGLEYNDEPAVVQVCPQQPNPGCSAAFREMRAYGTGPSRVVTNSPAEAVVPRLVAALRALDAGAPGKGWGGYLDGDQPRWDRIVVSGLSQGAGMAAFLAKRHAVRRVVLFSSPWEFTGADRRPAPWLSTPSATPMTRWHAEYHARENTVPLLRAAYAALAIPAGNILVFDRDLPPRWRNGPNPYHPVTIQDARYLPQWRAMFGRGSDPAE